MKNIYCGILKTMDEFQKSPINVKITYQLNNDYSNLLNNYPITDIAGHGSDFDKCVNLTNWVSKNIYHNPNYDNSIENSAVKLLNYSFQKDSNKGLNCRSLSMVLTESLLSIGIKARVLYILPMSPYDFENHVVCEAFIKELDKWVMFDPTYNLYFTENKPMNALELRASLMALNKPTINESCNYNGKPVNVAELYEYFAKNLFRFKVSDIQGGNSEALPYRKTINIVPVGYNVKKSTIASIDYAKIIQGENENLSKLRKNAENMPILCALPSILYN